MIMNRIGEIDRFLATCDFQLVDYYEQLTVEELFSKKEKLIKELDIAMKLKRTTNKSTKYITDAIDIVDLLIEKDMLVTMYKTEEDKQKGVILG